MNSGTRLGAPAARATVPARIPASILLVVRLFARPRRDANAGDPPLRDHADITAVVETVAGALDSGVVLLDGYEVILANEAAVALRVVHGSALACPPLSRLVRVVRHDRVRVEHDIELPWGQGRRPISATAAPVPGSDWVVLLLRDLTEERRVEAVRRDFVASVSHELKTPVGGLMLLAEAIRDASDDPEMARRFADRMVHEAGRLSDLVRDLLDLSRLQGGEPLPEPAAVPVNRLVGEAVDRVRVAADAAGIDVAAGEMGQLEVWGDERSLVTAVVNLLDNALMYSGRGNRVAVGARAAHNNGIEEVEISVADQGIGIPAGDIDRVFERFYRTDRARSRRTGGTGLGLSIVKHAVENSGGRVVVWSQPGMGSTFTIYLPAPPAVSGIGATAVRPRVEPESA